MTLKVISFIILRTNEKIIIKGKIKFPIIDKQIINKIIGEFKLI